jgi:hypothetical protein
LTKDAVVLFRRPEDSFGLLGTNITNIFPLLLVSNPEHYYISPVLQNNTPFHVTMLLRDPITIARELLISNTCKIYPWNMILNKAELYLTGKISRDIYHSMFS